MCALSSAAYADGTTSESAQPAGQRVWTVTIGGGTEYGPRYEGARNQSFSFVPYLDITRFGEAPEPSPPDDNFGFPLIDWHGLEVGPVVGYNTGRSTSDDSALEGLPNIDFYVQAGIYAQYWLVPDRFRLRFEGLQALHENYGFVADLSADYFQPIGSRIILSVGPRLSLADTAYMQNNFGITPEESAANGTLAPFNIGGGLKSVGFMVSADYRFTDTWSLQVYDKYERLLNEVADSPIVSDIGSANQNTVGVTLRRSFEISF
ncbi:MipA/OmpV family protein [Mesorhizobium sp. BAC0120]|uniref:MipA/OmpV family protein n=1 Tax=Mesorhizobium sp. BAC0120 TaxID=3090670 RepID=UPI00298D27A9|nr:MipA/OmpV family protein [Mesorhizobium sp. BAC0120]MDW6025477.1 MipA/OmpV family protein [Mesorhizobium sp. BAC0120]